MANLSEKIRRTRYMQYLAGVIAMLTFVSAGMSASWPSPSLPLLQSKDSPIGRPITDNEGSWIVSALPLAATPIPFVGAWTVEKFGRKKTLLCTALLSLIHWLLIIFGKSVDALIVARCFGGFSMGLALTASSLYTGEIAEPDIRGKISTYLVLMKILGSLAVLSVGPYISYSSLATLCSIVPVLFFCMFCFMPESPYYLVNSGDVNQARKNLIKLSSSTAGNKFIDGRIALIKSTIKADMAKKGSVLEFFTNKDYAFLIFLLFGIKSLHPFSGGNAFESYLQTIIGLTNSGLSSKIAVIIIGFIPLPGVIISGLLVDKFGRRPLLIISAIGCSIALLGEGMYFYIQDYLKLDTSSISWLATTSLAMFFIMGSIGIMPLPFVLLGELFPTNVKGIAVATSNVYGSLGAFLVTKSFKPLCNAIGIYSMFFIFAAVCATGALFVFVFVPETKGKNFVEIQKMLNSKGKRFKHKAN